MSDEQRKPPAKINPRAERARVRSIRVVDSLWKRFNDAALAEGRNEVSPFFVECAIDGLESRQVRAAMEAYRRTTRNTAGGAA